MSLTALALIQTVAAFTVDHDEPVRFGLPVPAEVVERGLALRGPPRVRWQWRPLQPAPPEEDGLWVEIAAIGCAGRTVVSMGGPPASGGDGPVVRRSGERREEPGQVRTVTRWHWCDGTVDRRETVRCTGGRPRTGTVAGGDEPRALRRGEARTVASAGLVRRWTGVRFRAETSRRLGLVPRGTATGRAARRRLIAAARAMTELPGARGAGDYARDEGVVTNLEFDTTLALVRAALASGDEELAAKAARSARHLIDRDLDRDTGLPFRHGPGHRRASPEPGHVWLQGLLWAGCLSADDDLIAGARTIARALARHPPRQRGRFERARDFAWPLLEMEAWLRFEEDPVVERAADGLAAAIAGRWDADVGTWRFGEGERRHGVYADRVWITSGIVVPALCAHLRRRSRPRLEEQVARVRDRVRGLLRRGRKGLPVRVHWGRGSWFGEVRIEHAPELWLMLAGLDDGSRRHLLARAGVRHALGELPVGDDPALATTFTMIARNRWVWAW